MTAEVLATAYAHGPGKWIEVGPTPHPEPIPGQRVALSILAGQGPFAAAVARLLTEVASPARWEQWNQYNDHRCYPSPRAAYPVDLELVGGGVRRLVDAARRATIGPVVPPLGASVRLEPVTRRERLSAGYGEFGDALVELEAGHLLAALAEHAPSVGLVASADPGGVTLRPGNSLVHKPLPPRSSGIGPRGLSADPRPLPHKDFRALLEALTAPAGLRHRIAVHNVTGVADGWYHLDVLERAGPAMRDVQAGYGHSPSTVEVSGMNVAVVTTADIPAAVAAEGPQAYRDLLRAAGGAAQLVCAAAARIGMFCRPVRSVDEPMLEAAVAAPLSHSLLYVLLAGRQRVACFPYDLTRLDEL